jgi:histidyl-tRNA synthetase
MNFKKPRGTRDILPNEMEARRKVEGSLRTTFERFGYREVQTPTFENLDLITAKSGEEINDHLYTFEDKSNRSLTLRPELSAPTIRLFVNELRNKPKPRKLYYIENCFRYERPQKGRYREFWQAGVELIGSCRPEAEAEVIALADTCLNNLGLTDYNLSIGHLGVIRALLSIHEVGDGDQNLIISFLDKGETKGLDEFSLPQGAVEDLKKITSLKGKGATVLKKAREILSENDSQELEDFSKLLELLKVSGVDNYIVDLGIARGLDYYTGMVFEVRAKGLGAQDQICGGGTYSLVKLFGGGDVPSCGFAFGFDRLIMALESKIGITVDKGLPKVFVVPETLKVLNRAINITSVLRKQISCDIELMGRNIDKSLSYANSENISYVIIISEGVKGDGVILKNMRTGEQRRVKVKEVPDAIG